MTWGRYHYYYIIRGRDDLGQISQIVSLMQTSRFIYGHNYECHDCIGHNYIGNSYLGPSPRQEPKRWYGISGAGRLASSAWHISQMGPPYRVGVQALAQSGGDFEDRVLADYLSITACK